jgi:hypothetical protein
MGTERFDTVGTDENFAEDYTERLGSYRGSALYADKEFTSVQHDLLLESLKKVFFRRDKQRIRDDAWARTEHDEQPVNGLITGDTRVQTFTAYVRKMFTSGTRIYVTKIFDAGNTVGLGWVNIVDYDAVPKKYFVGLNADYMTNSYSWGLNYHYWASVLAHEMLHNLGYRHEGGYPGSLITEWGTAIHHDRSGNFDDDGWINGRPDGFGLTTLPMPRSFCTARTP